MKKVISSLYVVSNLHIFNSSSSAPDGFRLDSLNLSHIDKIDSVWAQRHSRSKEFLAKIITHNPTNTKTDELVAWCIMLENGAMGNLQVDEKYYRHGLGTVTEQAQALKVAKDLNRELFGHIAHQNIKSLNLSAKNKYKWIDNYSWIGVKRREAQKLIPLWGHL